MGRLKYFLLVLSLGSAGAASWLLWSGQPVDPQMVGAESRTAGNTMRASGFRYTAMSEGGPVYRVSGKEMHDEHMRVGPLRISVLKVVRISSPEVELLRKGPGQGWVLRAEKGRIVVGRKELTLTGKVQGMRADGGMLLANRVIINVVDGLIQLKDGYELKTAQRCERGIRTTL